jgi:hypothetical protein
MQEERGGVGVGRRPTTGRVGSGRRTTHERIRSSLHRRLSAWVPVPFRGCAKRCISMRVATEVLDTKTWSTVPAWHGYSWRRMCVCVATDHTMCGLQQRMFAFHPSATHAPWSVRLINSRTSHVPCPPGDTHTHCISAASGCRPISAEDSPRLWGNVMAFRCGPLCLAT